MITGNQIIKSNIRNLEVSQEKYDPLKSGEANGQTFNKYFYIVYAIIQILIVASFAGMKYPDGPYGTDDSNFNSIDYERILILLQKLFFDTNAMMLLGFGFLIVFIRFHRWMSLGLTLFISSMSIQIYMIFCAFWFFVFNNGWGNGFSFTFPQMIASERATLAILITMGALVGKIDAFQMMTLAFYELIFYTFNEALLFYVILVRDIGGGFTIHTFGCAFGLIATWIYSPKSNCKDNPNINPSYNTSTLTFMGTLFLWVLFPSINSYNPWHKDQYDNIRFIATANTFWALGGSTVTTFGLTTMLNQGKLTTENIQNASLSGAVIIASCCDMFAFPYPSLLIGCFAGIVSTLSFQYLSGLLKKFQYYDTRGTLHLHGIPSIFGGIASACACSTLEMHYFGSENKIKDSFLFGRNAQSQGGFQFLGWLVSLLIALLSGFGGGLILRIWRVYNLPIDTFGDHIWWKMINDIPNNQLNQRREPIILPSPNEKKFVYDHNFNIINPANIPSLSSGISSPDPILITQN